MSYSKDRLLRLHYGGEDFIVKSEQECRNLEKWIGF